MSCLVPLPPVEEEELVRPNLGLDRANPPITQLVIAEYGDRLEFNVPLTYERDDQLTYQLWINKDLAPPGGNAFDRGTITPSKLTPATGGADGAVFEPELKFAFVVDTRFAQGCQQLTLFVTPSTNMSEEQGVPQEPLDMRWVAMATWWFNVAPTGAPNTLEDCPMKGSATDI